MNEVIISMITGTISLLFLLILIILNDRALDYDEKLRDLNTIKMTEESNKNLDDYRDNILDLISSIRTDINNRSIDESVLKNIDKLRSNIYTGRNSIDSVISNKLKACNSHGIPLDLCIDKCDFKDIEDVDLIPLLSNLLDNAIEAALLCEHRRIKLTIKTISNFYVIKISNSKLIAQIPIKNNFKTNKCDKVKHGLGTKIIRGIVKKNKGKISFNDEGELFTVKVIIPY